MEGKLQELSLGATWLFLTRTHRSVFKHSFFVGGGWRGGGGFLLYAVNRNAIQTRSEAALKHSQTCRGGRTFDSKLFLLDSWNGGKGKGVSPPQTLISGQLKAVVLKA